MGTEFLSEIHGNITPLDAMTKDIQARGSADKYWVLGGLAAIGHDPVGAIQRIAALPNAHVIRGNNVRIEA